MFLNTRGTADDVDEEMKEFLAYIENTTDAFAGQAKSPLVKKIHEKVVSVKQSEEMEVEYMTLLQRDRENIEQGIEQGEQRMVLLAKLLLGQDRAADLTRALNDNDYREQLYHEFGIS